MVAALWNRPQATFASKIELDGGKAKVTREVDAGLETIEVDLPAVFTSDLRLNEPRYVKLPEIMKAKKKPLDTVTFADLGVSPVNAFKNVKFEAPTGRTKGIMVKDVSELVTALKQKGVLYSKIRIVAGTAGGKLTPHRQFLECAAQISGGNSYRVFAANVGISHASPDTGVAKVLKV